MEKTGNEGCHSWPAKQNLAFGVKLIFVTTATQPQCSINLNFATHLNPPSTTTTLNRCDNVLWISILCAKSPYKISPGGEE